MIPYRIIVNERPGSGAIASRVNGSFVRDVGRLFNPDRHSATLLEPVNCPDNAIPLAANASGIPHRRALQPCQ